MILKIELKNIIAHMTKSLLLYIPVELVYHEEFLTLEEASWQAHFFNLITV
jgi:hypothetical protein